MNDQAQTDTQFCNDLCGLALAAGAKIMDIYAGEIDVEQKNDDSPVTEADRAGEKIILAGLDRIAPRIPVLAEERAAEGDIPALGDEFFLVDPLDGTKEFIKRTGEFTVNIALVRNGAPVIGVVYAPAIRRLYGGVAGIGAWRAEVDAGVAPQAKEVIRAVEAPESGLIAVASRSHRSPETDEYLSRLNVAEFAAAGSSLKFCLLAEGKAHLYPRFGRTMEWDTAAGQGVLEAAGGRVLEHPGGGRLLYGKKERGFDNPHFIASGL
ncbi:MAG: 3'(2'),5'-bisphosphate nucleotidase CysQ [Hyphococcus sp.]